MATESADLPEHIKLKVVEELKILNYVLDSPDPIGRGPFGFVYRAMELIGDDLIAIKVYVYSASEKERMIRCITRKIETMKECSVIPGVVPIYFSIIKDDFVLMGMEYCPNGSLTQYVEGRNGETIDENTIKNIVKQILHIMYHLVTHGKVHRDIKPENILFDRHGEIKLSGFLFVRDANEQSKISSKTIAGTERYLSPELKDGEPQSMMSDVWAFGVVMLELAYGRDAFRDFKLITMNPKKLISIFEKRGGYSIEMAQFLSRCFERESEIRATVKELLQDKWLKGSFPSSVVQESKYSVGVELQEVITSSKTN